MYGSAMNIKMCRETGIRCHLATGVFTSNLERMYGVYQHSLITLLTVNFFNPLTTWGPKLTLALLHLWVHFYHSLEQSDIQLAHQIPNRLSPLPPWHIIRLTCDLQLIQLSTGKPSALSYHQYCVELLSEYLEYMVINTDRLSDTRHSLTASTIFTVYTQRNPIPYADTFHSNDINFRIVRNITSSESQDSHFSVLTTSVPCKVFRSSWHTRITWLLWRFCIQSLIWIRLGIQLCFAQHLAIRACLVIRLLIQQPEKLTCMGTCHQKELWAVMFAPKFFVLYFHSGQMTEAIHWDVAVLQLYQEGGCPTHMPSDKVDSPDNGYFSWGDPPFVSTQCGAPYNVLCPCYDEECQTFNLHGALHDIVGDYHHNVL